MFSYTTTDLHRELEVELIGMESCSGSHFLGGRCASKGTRCD